MISSIGHIERLIEFSDEIIRCLERNEQPYNTSHYLMTLLYVEDILDKYGRQSQWIGDSEDSQVMATKYLDYLRQLLRVHMKTEVFQVAKTAKIKQLQREWTVEVQ